jgi:beta-N-acetylhexosaminidase
VRLALVVGLILLAVRAGMASAAFMAPGGAIVGWTHPPATRCVLCQVTVPTLGPQQHQLTPNEYAADLVQHLTLDDELGQMITVSFQESQPTLEDNQMVSAQDVGGVLFFGYNIVSAAEVRTTTAALQHEAPIPLLMMVDQEGGAVDRFKGIVGPQPSAASLTTPDQAQAWGKQDANVLHDNGFNLNLAPVADVGTSNPQLYLRTFGSDPARVATMAGAYLTGLQSMGTVTATVKHFAGLGATTTDPHLGLPILNRSRADWERIDVAPFRTLIATQDVRAIMVTHVQIPAVDPNLPTSLSPAVINGTLRQELGFQGVVITDDVFHMEALSARYPGPQAAVLAVEAGADEIIGPYSYHTVQQAKDAMKQAISNGTLSKDRIDLSVERILTLKIRMGLIPLPAPVNTPTASPSPTNTPHANRASQPEAYRAPENV